MRAKAAKATPASQPAAKTPALRRFDPAVSSLLFKGNGSKSGSSEPSTLRRLLVSEQPRMRKLLVDAVGADSADNAASSPSTNLRQLQAASSPASSRCCSFSSLHWTSYKRAVAKPPAKLTKKYKQASCSCANAMAAAPKPPPLKPQPKPSPPPACNITGACVSLAAPTPLMALSSMLP